MFSGSRPLPTGPGVSLCHEKRCCGALGPTSLGLEGRHGNYLAMRACGGLTVLIVYSTTAHRHIRALLQMDGWVSTDVAEFAFITCIILERTLPRRRRTKGGRSLSNSTGRPPPREDRGWWAVLRGTPWLSVLVIFGGLWVIYFVTAWLSFTPTPLPLKLAIDEAGSTKIVYDTTPASLISPACGCARDEPANWRGISFISRRFEILPPTAAGFDAAVYTVFAPSPGPFNYLPDQFRLKVIEYDVSVPSRLPLLIRVSREGPPHVNPEAVVTPVKRGDPHLYFS